MARGFFLPLAVEGKHETYITSMSVKYCLILSYIATLLFLLIFDASIKTFFIYQLSALLLINFAIYIHFVFWFDRHFGLETILSNLSKRQALISLLKSLITLSLTFLISLITYTFMERGKLPVNIILSLIFPYIFASIFHGGFDEGVKGFLKLINFRKA